MKSKLLFLSFLAFLICIQFFGQSDNLQSSEKKIVVLGSSVAAGWVSSFSEKYDMQNGYAYRLARHLQAKGWDVQNISIPGFDTKATIARFNDDVLPLHPDIVLIGLSMSNEGLESMNPDTVFKSYKSGITELIRLCRDNGIEPVVGLCYSNDNYTEEQYSYLKRMNMLIGSWNVASINFLGVLDDGHGHFPKGYTFDPNHPNDRGHEEMFFAIPPAMFEKIDNDQFKADELFAFFESHKHHDYNKVLDLGRKSPYHEISYIPTDLMHSFSMRFHFKTESSGKIAEIRSLLGANMVIINNEGKLAYVSKEGIEISGPEIKYGSYHALTITHQYLEGITKIYIGDELALEVSEQSQALRFSIGMHQKEVSYTDLIIYRAALNQEEVEALNNGNAFLASLELACALEPTYIKENEILIPNQGLSQAHAICNPLDDEERVAALKDKISAADILRENELKVKHRQAIEVDPAILEQYVGSYEIEPNDNLVVSLEDNSLFLDDNGRKAQILPESDDQFFIHYPGDLLIIFQRNDAGEISGLIFSINGREMKAKRIK